MKVVYTPHHMYICSSRTTTARPIKACQSIASAFTLYMEYQSSSYPWLHFQAPCKQGNRGFFVTQRPSGTRTKMKAYLFLTRVTCFRKWHHLYIESCVVLEIPLFIDIQWRFKLRLQGFVELLPHYWIHCLSLRWLRLLAVLWSLLAHSSFE